MTNLIINGIKTSVVRQHDKYDQLDYLNKSESNVKVLPGYPSSETEIRESSELGEALRELNNDKIELGTRTSGIDMRSRLHFMEVSSILALDTLVAFRLLPVDCLAFTRQKKRLAVSLQGRGRDDIVDIVNGQRNQDVKKGMNLGERLAGFFGGKKDKE